MVVFLYYFRNCFLYNKVIKLNALELEYFFLFTEVDLSYFCIEKYKAYYAKAYIKSKKIPLLVMFERRN